MLKRRVEAFPRYHQLDYGEGPIEGCSVIFACPLRWSDLTDGPTLSENKRKCQECGRFVYRLTDIEQVKEYAARGECVSFYSTYQGMYM